MSTTLALSTASLRIAAAPASIEPGVLLKGRYEVGSLLGQGGMAQVYEAIDVLEGRACVVKVPLGGNDFGRLEREGFIGERLKGPGLCKVLDRGRFEDGDTPYVIFERLFGETLGERLARQGALS